MSIDPTFGGFLKEGMSHLTNNVHDENMQLRLEIDALRRERDRWQRAARALWRELTEGE